MTSQAASRRVRHTPQERRRQLIGIGLEMLTRRPLHQVTIDDVAAKAGISRSLLFHYFPTKRDYYVEVVRAASKRLLRAVFRSATGERTVDEVVAAYLEFIERRHEPYIALFRSAGTDDWVREIFEQTRTDLVDGLLDVLEFDERGGLIRSAVGAWLSFAEELCLDWAQNHVGTRERVLSLLTGALHDIVARAQRP